MTAVDYTALREHPEHSHATYWVSRNQRWEICYRHSINYACYRDERKRQRKQYVVGLTWSDYYNIYALSSTVEKDADWYLDTIVSSYSSFIELMTDIPAMQAPEIRLAMLSIANVWLLYDADQITNEELQQTITIAKANHLQGVEQLALAELTERETADLCPHCEYPDTEEFHTNVPATSTEPGERVCHAISHCRLLDPDKYDDVQF